MRQKNDKQTYLRTNNNESIYTLTPIEWSVTRSKLEMSHAFENKKLVDPIKGTWIGESSNVRFIFIEPKKINEKWKGYPIYEP